MKNGVQLITYADRFGGTIADQQKMVQEVFGDAVTGVHILPFFTPFDGEDAGFDPIDHTEVDPRLGSWADLGKYAENYDLMADTIVNHMSTDSKEFEDFRKNGAESEYADLFLTLSSVFPDGATEEDLAIIYRPRPGLPFTPVKIAGENRLIWTTFTSKQADIDLKSEVGLAYLTRILDSLSDSGVTSVRLDAAGYAAKTPGTSCFMTPDTERLMDEIADLAHDRGMRVLAEVHSYYKDQIDLAKKFDLVYDFALPPLLLYSEFTGDARPLAEWLEVRPTNAVTVLDTHDGIGIIDVGPSAEDEPQPGLLTPKQLDELVEGIHKRSKGESRKATGAAASNLDLYQVNCTYFSALGDDVPRYLQTRAVQFFTPGVPQVYYVGAMLGTNDMELLASSGVGRDINRATYTAEQAREVAASPGGQALLALMWLRSNHPAFQGDFSFERDGDSTIDMHWANGEAEASLEADFETGSSVLSWSLVTGGTRSVDRLEDLTLDLVRDADGS